MKYITVTVTEQRFHCDTLNQVLHITQDTNKLSLSEVWLVRELISGPLSALVLHQLSHRCMALSEDLHVAVRNGIKGTEVLFPLIVYAFDKYSTDTKFQKSVTVEVRVTCTS